jgi:hypothetical protein
MSKAGSSLLRATFVRAADWARRQDPQLARIYHVQMTERGKDHLGALCVVAANLAEQTWAVMDRGMPYVVCDTQDNPVTPEEARVIIAERFTVNEEVRQRRRSKKRSGKAPRKSSQDIRSSALEAQANGATFPRVNPRATERTGSRGLLDKAIPDRESEVSLRQLLEHVEGLVGDDALEPGVLLLQFFQALGAVGLHAAVLAPPAGPGRLGDLEGAQDLGQVLALVQHPLTFAELADDLLGGVAVALHRGESSFRPILGLGLPQQLDHYPGPPSRAQASVGGESRMRTVGLEPGAVP